MAEYDDIIRSAIDTYGVNSQLWMLFEEMAELQNAICKWTRWRDSVDHIAEEIADCEIMLAQAKLIFTCTNKVEKIKSEKLERLERRLHGEQQS